MISEPVDEIESLAEPPGVWNVRVISEYVDVWDPIEMPNLGSWFFLNINQIEFVSVEVMGDVRVSWSSIETNK